MTLASRIFQGHNILIVTGISVILYYILRWRFIVSSLATIQDYSTRLFLWRVASYGPSVVVVVITGLVAYKVLSQRSTVQKQPTKETPVPTTAKFQTPQRQNKTKVSPPGLGRRRKLTVPQRQQIDLPRVVSANSAERKIGFAKPDELLGYFYGEGFDRDRAIYRTCYSTPRESNYADGPITTS